jgi:hypothetical protein
MMTKAEFLTQFVLNRAATHQGSLGGAAAAEEAAKAWAMIESKCPELKPDSRPKSSGSSQRATTSTSSPDNASAEPQSKPASGLRGEAAPKSDSGTGKP